MRAIGVQEMYSVVSMFSGCGGMDLGFSGGFSFLNRAYLKNPFEIIWANDANAAACRTYRHNISAHIREGCVWDHMPSMPDRADVVIGGFPCQDISINGPRSGIHGQRSGLYRAMVDAVSKLKPRYFIAENVKALLFKYNKESLETVVRDFSDAGYRVQVQLLNSAEFGVPQTRERVFIVGSRFDQLDFQFPQSVLQKRDWITCSQAVADLVGQSENPEFSHIWSKAKRSVEQGDRRMVADRPAYTIRAECHGNIHFHYSLPRRTSMREAARYQSFPDDFVFKAKLRETERQIGNAVPPVLAWHIGSAVADVLRRGDFAWSEQREAG